MKPNLPKGTRDFSPIEISKRKYIVNTIQNRFELHGFLPIETPSFENSNTLLGKYGEEGDRLLFKILNSGDFLHKVKPEIYAEQKSSLLGKVISEKALRYDLTVPFARYVVQHQHQIDLPFKRYQIQPVWRADRPQKGRFREFWQCDADVIGSKSLWQEVELLQLYASTFVDLGLDKDPNSITIKINHRKILAGLTETLDIQTNGNDFIVALDKLDKIGKQGVIQEMLSKGISLQTIDKLQPLFEMSGDALQQLDTLEDVLQASAIGLQGIADLRFILDALSNISDNPVPIQFDATLARGLHYYTGTIFEVASPKSVSMGSIGGGGRYDELTQMFGLQGMSGVGISFGLDRIYLVLEELGLFPETLSKSSLVLFLNLGEKEAIYAQQAAMLLREKKIPATVYPDAVKMNKQLKYANKIGVPFVVIAGTNEITNQMYTLKIMKTGKQQEIDLDGLIQIVRNAN